MVDVGGSGGGVGAASVATSGVGTTSVVRISIGSVITMSSVDIFSIDISQSSLFSPDVVTGVTTPSVRIPNNDCIRESC